MHRFRRIPALLCGLAAALALAGCSVGLVDGTKPTPSPRPDSTSSIEVQGGAATRPPSPAPVTAPPVTAPPVSSPGGADRAAVIAAATRTVRCDGEYALMDDAMIVRVEGACDRIIVNASGSQLVADDVALVEVIGNSNVVLTGAVQKVLVNGEANVVHWTGATPTVSDIGSTNTLTAG